MPRDDSLALRAAILEWLSLMAEPQPTEIMRSTLKIRKRTLIAALELLRREGLVVRHKRGWTMPQKATTE